MKPQQLAIVLSGFPRRSETFALAEIAALDERGLVAAIFSTKPGESGDPQPQARALAGRVHMLSGDPDAQTAEAAGLLAGTGIAGVHAYFAHAPAAIGQALARSLGVPFGFSVHARDARKVPTPELHARARRAACVVACNAEVAHEFDGSGARVQIVPHGVDLQRFDARPRATGPLFHLLAVGRLVEKKGFDILIDALSTVTVSWHLRIVGDGPERDRLTMQAQRLGIADRIAFIGSITHDALPLEYDNTDVVVVPSVVDRFGDRDGLPNVVLEAMASGRAVVATDTAAIPSAVRNGDSGVIVPAGDRAALAHALTRLATHPQLRAALGVAARQSVERCFDVHHCTDRLASVLQEAYA